MFRTRANDIFRAGCRSGLGMGIAVAALAAALLTAFAGSSVLAAAPDPAGQKTLIVYYSLSGNTRQVVDQIRNRIQADVVELKTVDPYPAEHQATIAQARQELEAGYRPPLLTRIPDLSDYAVVIIGSPNWWGTLSMPVQTFLSEHDLSGKSVALLITHGGSGLGRGLEDLKKFCPNAAILEGLAVRRNRVGAAQTEIDIWLRTIGLFQ